MSSPERRPPGVVVEIHVTPSFVADFGELERQIGSESKTVYDQLLIALASLREQEPQDALPITPYGLYGDSFQYKLNAEYVFTFKRVTDRDSERRPILFRYFLKNLLRTKS
jgi:hypothetical protein